MNVARTPRTWWIILVVIVSAVIVVAGSSALLGDKTVELNVEEGFVIGLIQGSLSEIDQSEQLMLNFSATTNASRSTGVTSALTMQLSTYTYFDGQLGAVRTVVRVTVLGNFDSDLHGRTVQISCNQTASGVAVDSLSTMKSGVNVSFQDPMTVAFLGSGFGSVTAGLVNRSEDIPFYEFSYFELFMIWQQDLDANSIWFRATVSGDFEPSVGVGITLRTVNIQT